MRQIKLVRFSKKPVIFKKLVRILKNEANTHAPFNSNIWIPNNELIPTYDMKYVNKLKNSQNNVCLS